MTVRPRLLTVFALIVCLVCVGCRGTNDTSAARQAQPSNGAASPVTIRFADLINVDVRNVPLLMAFDQLEQQGYVVETTHATGATVPADLLVLGDVDVAMFNNQTAWTAIAKGADIRTIVQYTGNTSVLAAREQIHSCRDLNHRPFGASSSAGLSPTMFALYLERHCPGAELTTVVIPQADARAAALLSARVDAAMMPVEQLIRLQQQSGVPLHALMSYAQEFPGVQVDGLHVRNGWAAEHPQAVKDLLRAQLNAHRQIRAKPEMLFAESQKHLKMDAAIARAVGESHLRTGIWDPNGGLTPDRVQKTIDFLVAAKALPDGLKADQVADLSYLNAVLEEIGRVPETRTPNPNPEQRVPSP